MSTLQYKQSIGGKGVAQGLPLRRASQLYDVEPGIRYPNAFSTGLDSDMHAYDRAIYLRLPHLPITFVKEPYINNPKAGGTFTRRQYMVIKRGQPLMASHKREASIGLFNAGGDTVITRTYNDPAKWASNGTLDGYSADNGTTVITVETHDGLVADTDYQADGSAGDGSAGQDYQKADFQAVYSGLEDTNDTIPTGGTDRVAEVEEALFGTSSRVKFTAVDADVFFFNAATRSEGFIYPSTGGCPRTVFFNEVDQEAMVTLPSDGTDSLRVALPIGNTTDVTAANSANWVDSALVLPVRPTIGFAHTDLEQATAYQFHGFQTGNDVHTPVRKGRLTIPFLNLTKFNEIMAAEAPGVDVKFTDQTDGRSGIKLGLFVNTDDSGDAVDVEVQNLYSLLTAEDAGYANLYYNFAAPFLIASRTPKMRDRIVPDLFGNYTIKGEVAIDNDANDFETLATANNGAVSRGYTLAAEKDAAASVQEEHVCGKVLNIYDTPGAYPLDLSVNPVFQSRIVDADRNALNSDNRRLRGADNAGMEPILSDFLFMLLGGSSYTWASAMLPKFGGLPQDLAKIIERLVIEGAAGLVEIAADTL